MRFLLALAAVLAAACAIDAPACKKLYDDTVTTLGCTAINNIAHCLNIGLNVSIQLFPF